MANRPNPIELQKHLSGLDYPASKDAVVAKAEESGAPEDVLEALRGIPDREYEGPSGVSSAFSDQA
ncbi:DUF2795 domain-containing protein [Pseudokineococcus sp. 1T1Z-3]|uniref:DUF2795 domain-containing protein n=1 Tax=Pseudokineococcus sp. 1T1Z-3 TaxID=3132745 RepID=UPI0030ACE0A9